MLDEVLVPCGAGLLSYSSPALRAELRQRSALDVAQVGDCNHHVIVGIEVFRVKFFSAHRYLGAALVSVFLLDFESFLLYDIELLGIGSKDLLAAGDESFDLVILGLKLFLFQSCELTQTHIHDCSCLHIGKSEQ